MEFKQRESFIVGKDSFEDLTINDAKNGSGFYYFKNSKGLVKKFILEEASRIDKICFVTFIRKGKKFTPRFIFQIRDKTKKAVENYEKNKLEHGLIKASVNFNSCYENFISLISFIKDISNIDFDSSSYSIMRKEDKKMLESILKKNNGQELLQRLIDNELLTDKDLVNTGYRKNQLKIFNNLLNNEGCIEKYKTEHNINGSGNERQILYYC